MYHKLVNFTLIVCVNILDSVQSNILDFDYSKKEWLLENIIFGARVTFVCNMISLTAKKIMFLLRLHGTSHLKCMKPNLCNPIKESNKEKKVYTNPFSIIRLANYKKVTLTEELLLEELRYRFYDFF